jgi:20S proteasome alpha/beta subunit
MQLLVFGFEDSGFAKFAEINEGDIVDHSDIDAWAVGTGTYLALGSLNSRYRGESPITKIIKDACEAKFSAEFADAVGPHTSVYVWYQNGSWWQMPNHFVNKLRDEWNIERSAKPIIGKSDEIIEQAFLRDWEFKWRMAAWRDIHLR